MNKTDRRVLGVHVAVAAGGVIMLGPFVLMLAGAFLASNPLGGELSPHITLDHFRDAWAALDWPRVYGTSVLVTGAIFIAQVVTSLPIAYALARWEFRGRRPTFKVVLVCLVIPPQVTAIPIYFLMSGLGLLDSYSALILPSVGSGFCVYLFRQFILAIPVSMFDAARLDGVGPVAMLWRVVFPHVRPALVAAGVFSVVSHWNDLYWPSVMLTTDHVATVPYAVAGVSGPDSTVPLSVQLAVAALAALPLLLCFVLVQRHLVRGLVLTADGE
ncbi:carbohydrate ABC transporter permease [Streptomyces sp. GMR22]|uniref:carbohydrate ABC transporter permease n=1 Tax=Streptomyces sp. GMR22 TaxID=2759524 RepID=UPI0015FD44A0|nr:carbohydrate ABC transporter permease [Streptomyces sp. GMR22]MBA6440708.1 carbohydrate ABC transporter permease [Streptomyces sp. GMR22]